MGSAIKYPDFKKCLLYTNNIFTYSLLHDVYVHTIGYTLIRIHKTFQKTGLNSSDRIRMDSFKFPVE